MTTEVETPITARLQGTWLTWVGATTGCLQYLGVKCDVVDVVGLSGYAFRMGIHRELCPSGPTVFDWQSLLQGVWKLGRSTVNFCGHECHTGKFINERTIAHSKAAFELARSETAAGRPCVIWGAYLPEFAVCIGTDDEHYFVDSCRKHMGQPQPPIRWDQLDAPGGLYVLGFPTAMAGWSPAADRDAIRTAVRILSERDADHDYAWGAGAYDLWAAAAASGKYNPFGAGYNAACWQDCRHLAARFVERIAARTTSAAKADLEAAASGLERTASVLKEITQSFPFPGAKDPTPQPAAAEFLSAAKAADADALAALQRALKAW